MRGVEKEEIKDYEQSFLILRIMSVVGRRRGEGGEG